MFQMLDLRRRGEGAGRYTMPGACSNCAWRGTLLLSKGQEAPKQSPRCYAAECPTCGCKCVGARKP